MTLAIRSKRLRVVAAATAAVGAVLAASLSQSATAAQKPSIIWLEQGAGNPAWVVQHNAAAEAGRRLGYTFKAVSGNLVASDQANILRQLVNQKPSAIIVNAINPASIVPAIKYATGQGHPGLSIYASIPAATASATFNEQRSGQIMAKQAVALLKQRYGKVEGQIAVLEGVLGQPASDLRANGFIDYMKQYPGVKIVATDATDWGAPQASAAMQDWLVKYPQLSMVYGLSDTISEPAANVAQRQNRLCTQSATWKKNPNCIIFVSVDGTVFSDLVNGTFFADEAYALPWAGFVYGTLAYDLATHKSVPKVTTLNSLLTTSANAVCVNSMMNAMTSSPHTFPFNSPSLQALAQKRGCKVLD